jgi:hypothetical protein
LTEEAVDTRQKILVVDDDPDLLEMYRVFLVAKLSSQPDRLPEPKQAGYSSNGPMLTNLLLGFSFSGFKEPGKGRPHRIRLRSSSTSHARATCARALAVVSGLKASASKTRCIATACEKAVEQFGRDFGPALSGSSGAACM